MPSNKDTERVIVVRHNVKMAEPEPKKVITVKHEFYGEAPDSVIKEIIGKIEGMDATRDCETSCSSCVCEGPCQIVDIQKYVDVVDENIRVMNNRLGDIERIVKSLQK